MPERGRGRLKDEGEGGRKLYKVFISLQMNLGGASDRPIPADIWRIVQLKMSGQASEQEIQDAYTSVQWRGALTICAIM